MGHLKRLQKDLRSTSQPAAALHLVALVLFQTHTDCALRYANKKEASHAIQSACGAQKGVSAHASSMLFLFEHLNLINAFLLRLGVLPSAPGRSVPQVIAALREYVDPSTHKLLLTYQQLILDSVSKEPEHVARAQEVCMCRKFVQV